MSKLQRLFKHSLIYAIGSGIQGIAGFILIPLYTKNLSVADFGKLDLLNTLFLIIASTVSLGLPSAYIKVIERDINKENKENKTKLASTAFIFTLFFSIATLGLLALCIPYFSEVLNLRENIYLYIVFSSSFVFTLGNIGFAYLRADEKSGLYTTANLVRFALLIGINTFFVLVLQMGIIGVLSGTLLSYTTTLILLLFPILKRISLKFSFPLLKKLLSFGIAIIPAGLSLWIMDLIDRYFINYFLGYEEVGIYSLAYKIGIALSILLVTPFQLAWPTFSFSIAQNKAARSTYSQVLTYFLIISLFIITIFTALGKQGLLILGNENYLAGADLILPITLSYLFLGIHYIIVVGLHIKDKSKWYPLLIVFPALLNIILNFLLIPQLGIFGAAISTLSSFAFMALLTHIVVQKIYGFAYQWSRITRIILAFMAAIGVHYTTRELQPEMLYAFLSIALFLLFLFVLRVVSFNELKSAQKLFTSLVKK